jgi:hypothetical protein
VPVSNDCEQGEVVGTIVTPEQVSHQAVIEMLGRVLVGMISFTQRYIRSVSNLIFGETSVLKTNLAFSDDLAHLYAYGNSLGSGDGEYPDIMATAVDGLPLTGIALGTAIEQLFHNMTLALFTDAALLRDNPPMTNS